MSAPPLSQSGPFLEGHSFYNPPKSISPATSVTNKECTQDPEETAPVGGAFETSIAPNHIYAPYFGEDARVTQLRGEFSGHPTLNIIDSGELDQMFRKMAGETLDYACIPTEMVKFLPSITRGLIQLFGKQQAKVSELEMSHPRNQDTFQAGDHMRGYISWLQGENEKLQAKIDDLRDVLSKAEQNYISMKAQKDFLKSALELEREANSEFSNKETSRKRMHGE